MKSLLAGCVCILALAACNDALAPSSQKPSTPNDPALAPTGDVWAGHYIVVLKSGVSSPDALLRRVQFQRQPVMAQKFTTVLKGFSASMNEEDVQSLRADPDVERVEPDRLVHQLGTETGMGWALDRIDEHFDPLDGQYAYAATGRGINIYIVDGGIRYSHHEFGGRAHLAFDAFGGNGSDCNGHGTGVAGVAAGSVHGVAKGATLWSVKVFPCSGTTTLSTILAGVDWVTAHHQSPAVANLSLGANNAPILDSAVARSIRSGVTYVVAGGNSGTDACTLSPAKLRTTIAVGASDANDNRPSWSNYGACIALFAPGAYVAAPDYTSDYAVTNWNGTSVAAPFVAGAAALYLEKHPSARPSDVRYAITSNATVNQLASLAGSTNKLLFTGFLGSTSTTTTVSTTSTTTTSTPTTTTTSTSFTPKFTYVCNTRHSCSFDASGSTVPNGVSSYNWYFGDGYQGTMVKVTHDYPSARTVNVTLLIVDRKLVKKQVTRSVVVP
jgi:aqualysin 1